MLLNAMALAKPISTEIAEQGGKGLRKHAVNPSMGAPPPHPCGGGFATAPPPCSLESQRSLHWLIKVIGYTNLR